MSELTHAGGRGDAFSDTRAESVPKAVLHEVSRDRLAFWCPGCKTSHHVSVRGGAWSWNGSYDQPTLSPSVLVTGWAAGRDLGRCHSFVKDGQIQFLAD